MAHLARFSAGKLFSQLMNSERNGVVLMTRAVTIKPHPLKPIDRSNYDEFNQKLGRPMSPHLLIYKPQLTSVMSVTHRITGGIQATVTSALGVTALILPQSLAHYVDAIGSLSIPSPIFLITKAILVYPFVYHMCNGTRHLCWDLGFFLQLKEVYATGYTVLLCSAVITMGIVALC